ncbi:MULTISPECIES: beta-glucosidase BglX [unclassified Leeuwenhoekiella]|uniref:beta-glucosidase BglX n=1 Tax=unclassified Leeuwenhoekiella TaxID=2615029 RepID=UPI000C3ABB5C|nr:MULTISPECIES: beta-glucosidase BglX [unclassified Leeuwenhoekiella]MAW94238.1 beta-glucosidase BglX [Leeuwenhoekiella sp.]MAW96848.1 beta-glucosidase BglX [Leeuwenhoekiella sp.]MBA80346.1 beta-glucosidase BglX [Leeuwenhoekiella sp.]|tara:strand:+ start:37551 stop:39827 length:2277 start_codon:yes stop_codon:yes gene_type:complete
MKTIHSRYILIVLLCISVHAIGQKRQAIPEVEALLKKMTLEEKIGQLNLLTPGGGVATGSVVSKNVEEKIKAGNVGGLFGVSGPDKIRQAQEIAVKNTRLGIPLLIGSDVIHGYKTTFPIPLGLSSSWDMELIEKTARIAAQESTADGINWNFSPMVDIARDPRWGRIAEGAGEDPYLGSQIAKAMVEGYQQDDLAAENTMIATVKHFALYGAAEGGRDYNTTDMSRVKMFNEYLPPYKAAIDAGAESVMSSFNDVDGVPASGNKWLLTTLLRDRWGFDGFVVSDYTSVNEMIAHGMGDLQAVSALSINAGLDMDMVGEGFLTTLKKSVEEGKVTEETITNACRRILEAKYRLGLFEDPYKYSDSKRPQRDILTDANKVVAREAARKSFVLLKNENNTLPLAKNAKIALVGPLANSKNNMLGTWAPTGNPQLSIPILEGLKNGAPDAQITYAKGANISNDSAFAKKVNVFGPRIEISEESPEGLLAEALLAAKNADIVVAVVGEATEMSGEAGSRTDITIPESQKHLIRELVKTGKPVVLVLMSGRPLVITEEMDLPVSILQVWHPGIEAGNAVADVVFGDYNPSGKLTASWPRNVGQIPVYHSMKNTGRPAPGPEFEKFKSQYLDSPNAPLLPFGYGLSYTSFEYKNLSLAKKEINQDESLEIQVDVTNTGDRDGEEVVQLYLHDKVRSLTPPVRTLKGFEKVFLKKGETKTVTLTLEADDLKFYNGALDFVAEPGEFEIFVGGNSNASLKDTFTLN